MPSKTAVPILPSEAESPEAPFYIAATQAIGRPHRTLKDGDTFAVLDSHGDITATPSGPDGLFYHDTRYLSHLKLLINEKRPLLLASNIRDDNSALFVDLRQPRTDRDGAAVRCRIGSLRTAVSVAGKRNMMIPENIENRPTAFAAEPMAPSDIQATFFDGKPFTASTTSGTQFKFTPDGKMTRQPRGKPGKKSSGTWKLGSTGFCTSWKGAETNCYTVVPSGKNKWSIQKGFTAVAVWSK